MEQQSLSEKDGCKLRVLIGVTGSVASLRLPLLVEQLSEFFEVRVVATARSFTFFDRSHVKAEILTDSDEWAWKERKDPVLHIELRKWADLFLIAPLDANTLAKISCGICDNLLTSVARAWDFDQKPVIVAPAMNSVMWEHRLTKPQLEILRSWGCITVGPISKTLVCGDTGVGAMAEVVDIVAAVRNKLSNNGTIN